jgi:hypothetical protein
LEPITTAVWLVSFVANTEDEMKRAVYVLNNIAVKYNFNISVNMTKAMAMKGKKTEN